MGIFKKTSAMSSAKQVQSSEGALLRVDPYVFLHLASGCQCIRKEPEEGVICQHPNSRGLTSFSRLDIERASVSRGPISDGTPRRSKKADQRQGKTGCEHLRVDHDSREISAMAEGSGIAVALDIRKPWNRQDNALDIPHRGTIH